MEVPAARDHAWKLIEELDVDHRRPTRSNRLREVDADDRVIRLRPAVRVDEDPRQIDPALLHLAQLDPSPLALLRRDAAAERAVLGLLRHERAARSFERIQIEMEVEARDLEVAPVAPGQLFLARDGVRDRIEHRFEAVIGDAVGQRRFATRSRAAPRTRLARYADRAGTRVGKWDCVGTRRDRDHGQEEQLESERHRRRVL